MPVQTTPEVLYAGKVGKQREVNIGYTEGGYAIVQRHHAGVKKNALRLEMRCFVQETSSRPDEVRGMFVLVSNCSQAEMSTQTTTEKTDLVWRDMKPIRKIKLMRVVWV